MMIWHKPIWDDLQARLQTGQLPHAFLITSAAGCGLEIFAWNLAATLLCHQPQAFVACGGCQSCCLLKQNQHPDAYHLQPLDDTATIKIDAVRDIQEKLAQTAQIGLRKVVVIEFAENLTRGASACLLKLLEEPPEHSFFVLLNQGSGHLEKTLKSRCQRLPLPKPTQQQALLWLQSQGISEEESGALLDVFENAPLAVQQALQSSDKTFYDEIKNDFINLLKGMNNPVQLAEKYEKQEMDTVFLGLFYALKILARKIPDTISTTDLLKIWQILVEKRKNWLKVATINKRLLIESLFIASLATIRTEPSSTE